MTHLPRRRGPKCASLAWLAVAAALGCSPKGGGGGGGGSAGTITLAPGAVVVDDAGEAPLGSAIAKRDLLLADVARLGSTLVALVDLYNETPPLTGGDTSTIVTSQAFGLLMSSDAGATWTNLGALGWPGDSVLTSTPMPMGVMLAAGVPTGLRAYVVGRFQLNSINAQPQRTLREYDLVKQRYLANPTVDDVLFSDGFAQSGTTGVDFASFTGGMGAASTYIATLSWNSVALGTSTLSSKTMQTATAFRYPDIWTTHNGGSWFAADDDGTQVCVYRVTPSSSLTPTRTCKANALYPPEVGTPRADFAVVDSSRGPLLVGHNTRAADGHVIAATLDAAPIALDLGVGSPPGRDPGIHPLWGGFVRLEGAAAQGIVDVTATGIDQITVPATPCVADDCGGADSVFNRLLPLSDGTTLAFYTLEAGAFSSGLHGQQVTSHPIVVAMPVTPTRTPLPGQSLTGVATVATGLENACTAMASCFGVSRATCIATFASEALPSTSKNKLLLMYTSGCAALADIWPDVGWVGRTGCVAGCTGNVAVTCATGGAAGATIATATDCDRYAATCASVGGMPACGDGSASLPCGTCDAMGSAVTCDGPVPIARPCTSRASVCAATTAGPVCASSTACTNEVSCSGTSLSHCVEGHFKITDCGEIGQTCTTDGGGACVSTTPYAPCADHTFTERCEGTRAIYCSGATLQSTDCAALGFPGCKVVGNEAICATTAP